MNFKEHRKDFNKRWNINLPDSYEKAFQKFKQRILNIFQSVKQQVVGMMVYYLKGVDNIITDEGILDFCQYYSIQEKYYNQERNTIIDRLNTETNEKEFYRLSEVILYLDIKEKNHDRGKEAKQHLTNRVIEAVEISDVNVAIVNLETELSYILKEKKN